MLTHGRKDGDGRALASLLNAVCFLVVLLGFVAAPAPVVGAPSVEPVPDSRGQTMGDGGEGAQGLRTAALGSPHRSTEAAALEGLAEIEDPEDDDDVRPHEPSAVIGAPVDHHAAIVSPAIGVPVVPFRLLAYPSRGPPVA